MDRLKTAALMTTLLIASGCTALNEKDGDGGVNNELNLAEDRGLKIMEFRPTDNTLRPSQPAKLNLKLRNYNRRDINITNLFIYNEGLLTVENKSCSPLEDFEIATCDWDIEAPEASEYGFEDSKPASLNLHLEYEAFLTNREPFKVKYKPLSEINSTSSISKTFGNSEVRMSVSTEEPVPLESSRSLKIKTKEVGQGRLASNTNYSFKFTPSSLFSNCEREDAPVVGKELKFSCTLESSEATETRFLKFSTSYKYVKEPILNRIKLVK